MADEEDAQGDAEDFASDRFLAALLRQLKAEDESRSPASKSYNGRSHEDVVQEVVEEVLTFLTTGEMRGRDCARPERTPAGIRNFASRRLRTLISTYRRSEIRQRVLRMLDRDLIVERTCGTRAPASEHPYYDDDLLSELLGYISSDKLACQILTSQIAYERLPQRADINPYAVKDLAFLLDTTELKIRAARDRTRRAAKKLLNARRASDERRTAAVNDGERYGPFLSDRPKSWKIGSA